MFEIQSNADEKVIRLPANLDVFCTNYGYIWQLNGGENAASTQLENLISLNTYELYEFRLENLLPALERQYESAEIALLRNGKPRPLRPAGFS